MPAEPASSDHVSPAAATSGSDAAEKYYQESAERCAARLDELSGLDRRFTHARLAAFLAAAMLYVAGLVRLGPPALGYGLAILTTLGFVVLVFFHERVQRETERLGHLQQIFHQFLARRRRQWKQLPESTVAVPPEYAATANDLDVFGKASLFQFLNLAQTPMGRETLRDWLLHPAGSDEIQVRQQAVIELRPLQQLREELMVRGRLLRDCLAGPEAFVSWAESEPWFSRHKLLRGIAWLAPVLFVGCMLFWILAPLPWPVPAVPLVALLIAHVLLSIFIVGDIHDTYNRVSTRHGEVEHYVALLDLVVNLGVKSPLLKSLRDEILQHEHGALRELNRLNRLMTFASLRHAGLLSILYFALQAAVLWDFHLCRALEKWQHRNGRYVRGWFQSLGRLEALVSFAWLAHDHPTWCFPAMQAPDDRVIRCQSLGHPLIRDDLRVCNDVQVGPPGTLLLVTGSNMSGKSTLLRSIGVNVMLAQAGSPVCASSMSLPPLEVTTSMRIHDSLESGVSFYMAELQRLKQIVDEARRFESRPDRCLLYLLDEILQGTNSRERHLAVCRVLSHLVRHGAIGAVSTHDLELASSDELSGHCTAVHFRETLHDDPQQPMTFDYLMRSGVATTTNALKLLEIVGLDPQQGESRAGRT